MQPTRRAFLGALATPFIASRLPAAAAPVAPVAAPKPKMPSQLGTPGTPEFWKKLRAEFTIPRDEVFFNTGTLGSSPLAVQEAVIAHMRHVDRDIAHWDYKPDHEQYFTGYAAESGTRDALAKILNCSGKDLATRRSA
jgi:hypothetical protein